MAEFALVAANPGQLAIGVVEKDRGRKAQRAGVAPGVAPLAQQDAGGDSEQHPQRREVVGRDGGMPQGVNQPGRQPGVKRFVSGHEVASGRLP